MQALRLCQTEPRCCPFRLDAREDSTNEIAAWPGMTAAANALGWDLTREGQQFWTDMHEHIDAIGIFSTFCLTPPGDTPKRKGLIDAWNLGCIPIIFDVRTRELPLFLTPEEGASMTVFIEPDAFHAMTEPGDLAKHLEAMNVDVLAMQRTILSKVTRLHWAYSDLGEEDHAAVGPDAFDIVLRQLARSGASMATVMAADTVTGASPDELSQAPADASDAE